MDLLDLVQRTAQPEPWAEGDNIPWHEPSFSERMLREHLTQAHDMASRRAERVERHSQWIHGELLSEQSTRVLDLGCGPGFYASRLAALGHECVGIDYSPASIRHAEQHAADEQLSCTYHLADIREADYGTGFGLVMLIFGELNVFRPADARRILGKAHAALTEGGLLLLEPQTLQAVESTGKAAPTFDTAEVGLFSDAPHLCLTERFWDAASRVATTRYYVVDAATAEVTPHASSMQAYDDEEYRSLLTEHGFGEVELLPSLAEEEEDAEPGLIAIVARKTNG